MRLYRPAEEMELPRHGVSKETRCPGPWSRTVVTVHGSNREEEDRLTWGGF